MAYGLYVGVTWMAACEFFVSYIVCHNTLITIRLFLQRGGAGVRFGSCL